MLPLLIRPPVLTMPIRNEMNIDRLYQFIKWLVITLASITLLRTLVILYLKFEYDSTSGAGIYNPMLDGFGVSDRTFNQFDSGQISANILVALTAIFFALHLVVLINRSNSNKLLFHSDLLLARPKHLSTMRLGPRRVLSILTNLPLIVGLLSMLVLPLWFIFDFPFMRVSGDDLVEACILPQVMSILTFWVIITISSVLKWLSDGFKI